ncbi:MAG: amino acid permease [Isosphaeraceae bacterium]
MLRRLFATKSLDDILKSTEDGHASLNRSLGPISVTLLGIGAIIGTGIYATIGTATAGDAIRPGAGPSLMISFLITAIVCSFTALCYAEFASLVPVSGSAYTYSYATLGELVAWIIGWDLIIEYGIGNVAVSISWASYFRSLLDDLGIAFPRWLATDFRTARILLETQPARYQEYFGDAPTILGVPVIFNLLAFGITMAITGLLIWGIRESARFNAAMVLLKVLVLVFFVGFGLWLVPISTMHANWEPFQPKGWGGTLAGAAVVFFAYIGFDAVSTVAEETKRPGRDLPIGILASLAICTVFYVIIAAVFSGMIPYQEVVDRVDERAESLTMALRYVTPAQVWPRAIIGVGSVVAQTAVLLVFLMGQPRIFFSMARDGLLPPIFARVHPRFKTPYVTTLLTGLVVAVLSGVASIDEMVDLTNIGTLFAFVLVCIGIPILRRSDPDRPRAFRVPFGPWLMPGLGAASCLFLMYYLPPSSWWRFVGWLVLGLAVYFSYGYVHSEIGRQQGRPSKATPSLFSGALGFLMAAVGLWIVPHDLGPAAFRKVLESGLAGQEQIAIGVTLVLAGLVAGFLGVRKGLGGHYPPVAGGHAPADPD